MFDSSTPRESNRRQASAVSLVVHCAALAVLWSIGAGLPGPPSEATTTARVVSVVQPIKLPRLERLPAPPAKPIERAVVKPKRFDAPAPSQAQRPKQAVAKPAAPVLQVETRVMSLPEAPAPRTESAAPPAPTPAGFGEVLMAKVEAPKLATTPGAFKAIASGRTTASTRVETTNTGFGTAGTTRVEAAAEVQQQAGFAGAESGQVARTAEVEQAAGFGAAQRKEATAVYRATPTVSADKPVRVLWKPSPQYSEEALERRVEGDVVLLVRFLARGAVETMKVVSGLGYGLDEYALQAAESIRFEPATKNDQPVDYVAQVRIRFELAY